MYLRGVEVTPGGRGMLLKSQSIVQIGSSIFTFVLPSSKSAANKQDVDVSIKTYTCPASCFISLLNLLVIDFILLHTYTACSLFSVPLPLPPFLSSPFLHYPFLLSLFIFTLTSLPPSPTTLSFLFFIFFISTISFISSHRPLRINDSPSPCPSRPP